MTTATAITAAPTSGQKIVIDDILVSTAVAMEFTLQEETSATVFSSFSFLHRGLLNHIKNGTDGYRILAASSETDPHDIWIY